MNVTFYNHAKRVNSTKVPADAGTSFNCYLKDGCSKLNPIIELQGFTGSPNYNYARISDWGRYYWVNDWVYERSVWTAYLSVDPLASFKTIIGNKTLYVLRSASQSDGAIIDNYYPIKMTCTTDATDQTESAWWALAPAAASGSFIVGVRGRVDAGQSAGGVTYLVMTAAQYKEFCNHLFDDNMSYYNGGGWQEISDELAKIIFNPAEYVTGAIWLPGSVSNTQAANTNWRVGWWDLSQSLPILLPASELTYTATISLAVHPSAAARGSYVNAAPYTERLLQLPRAGVIPLNDPVIADAAASGGHVTVNLRVDPISGEGVYTISCEGVTLDRIHCQIGVSIPLADMQISIQDVASPVSAVMATGAQIMGGNPVGAAMAANGAIGSALSALAPHITDLSSASGYLGLVGAGFCTIFSIFRDITDDDNTEHGRPLCQNKKINMLSGYVQVLNGDIDSASATSTELDSIRNYLESGFYYE